MPPREHTDSQYETELTQLRNSLLYMGGEIEKNIGDAIRALVEGNESVGLQVIQRDHVINCLEVDIDDLCLRILALRQPAASDLRFITTALKIVTDLERIGDLATNIAERAVELSREPPLMPYTELASMAGMAQQMVKDALDAFVRREPELAEQVIRRDRTIDELNARVFRELLTLMTGDPRAISRAIGLMGVAKHVERIGDHATNVAEMVVFMVRGKDIRHLWSRQQERVRSAGRG
jgi:phosphate transport system protein